MIKLAICFYILCLSIGALSAAFRFFIDIKKWHSPEEKTIISPAAKQINEYYKNESEVSIDDVIDFTSSEVHAGKSCESDS